MGDPRRTLTFIVYGYMTLVGLALYADYKIQMRRARRRREAREREADPKGKK